MVLVAVSGGRDSMVLAEKVRREGGPFAVAHCNFRLRGADSDADEALVRDWAARYGVPCHVKVFDTEAYAATEGISIEMAARKLRYRWFGELCRAHGYEAVLVAHHAGDNAETFFLNLLRGTGIQGLTGMKERSFLPDPDYADIPLRRPLLGLTRADIDSLVAEWQLPFREDRTNAENTVKRNKFRNQVFPVLREINPSFEKNLSEDMGRLSMAAAIADGEADLAIGTERISRQIDGLDFIPLLEERYDLVLRRDAMKTPAAEGILGILRSAAFKKEISHFTGNSYRDMGKIIAEV